MTMEVCCSSDIENVILIAGLDHWCFRAHVILLSAINNFNILAFITHHTPQPLFYFPFPALKNIFLCVRIRIWDHHVKRVSSFIHCRYRSWWVVNRFVLFRLLLCFVSDTFHLPAAMSIDIWYDGINWLYLIPNNCNAIFIILSALGPASIKSLRNA